jgi:hypothetical protein
MSPSASQIDLQVADVLRRRLTSVNGRDVLVRLGEAGLIERGCVVLLGLDAIRDRLGARWDDRRDRVWEAVHAHVSRRLGPHDLCVQVSDTDLAVAAIAGKDYAQLLAVKCLQELLIFFLGSYRPDDMRVSRVAWIDEQEIGVTYIDAPAGLVADTPAPPAPSDKAPLADVMREWSCLSFNFGGGAQNLDASLVLETLLAFKPGAPATPIGLRIHNSATDRATGRRINPYALSNLTLAEQIAIDRSTLDFTHQVLELDPGILVVPISFEVASSSRGRALLSSWFSAHAEAATRVVVELVRVDAGTPSGRLTEAAASLHTRVRRVMVRAEPSKAMLATLRGCRINGVSLDCNGMPGEDCAGLLSQFGPAARNIAPMLCALGLSSMAAADHACELGFTHGSLDAE